MTPSNFKGERLKSKQGVVTVLHTLTVFHCNTKICWRSFWHHYVWRVHGWRQQWGWGSKNRKSKACKPRWLRSSRNEGENSDETCGTSLSVCPSRGGLHPDWNYCRLKSTWRWEREREREREAECQWESSASYLWYCSNYYLLSSLSWAPTELSDWDETWGGIQIRLQLQLYWKARRLTSCYW